MEDQNTLIKEVYRKISGDKKKVLVAYFVGRSTKQEQGRKTKVWEWCGRFHMQVDIHLRCDIPDQPGTTWKKKEEHEGRLFYLKKPYGSWRPDGFIVSGKTPENDRRRFEEKMYWCCWKVYLPDYTKFFLLRQEIMPIATYNLMPWRTYVLPTTWRPFMPSPTDIEIEVATNFDWIDQYDIEIE